MNSSMKSFEIELLQKTNGKNGKNRRGSVQQDDWDKFLDDSRQNLATVADPQSCEGWKFLRPPNVGALAAGLEQIIEEKGLEEARNKVWIPDPKEGFEEAEIIREEDNGHTLVYCKQEELSLPTKDLQELNPVCFNFCEDMARLTHLNEASILYNLRQRFRINLIHTYSGLFCITVNPWRQLPIYTGTIVSMYKGQNQKDMPPHIYAVADNAYSNLLHAQENQSILITGESGAGKTENTKKILQYFAAIASKTKTRSGKATLEKQILETNPVLESFGNAKTLHNDNSSRFGKFIRVNFDSRGKVSGAEIESYLLEKSRVIAQSPNERSYHIFYQLLSEGMPELKESLKLSGGSADYRFISESTPEIQGVDDAIEMIRTDKALTTLGFSLDEKMSLYQMTAAVLSMGEMKFAQRSAGDQAYPNGVKEAATVSHLLGLNLHKFLDCLTEPTVTVGEEVVKKGQNLEQVLYSVSAVAKAVYEKSFRWLVKRCNKSISVRASDDATQLDIGVLDIAGFEIFRINSFEQLCINYTNEKLQQFFNHHMFIREQDEYRKENIVWDYIDYGMDLQPTIDLMDKPLGIFSILEEQCIMPKGSDRALADKLHAYHLGKSPQFGKPKLSKKSGILGDFSIVHYAGLVNYNVEGWIDKNKDPLNECIVRLFQNCENYLFGDIWKKYGPSVNTNNTARSGKRRGSFSFLTVSVVYRDQLNNLVNCLNKTRPHFVRCIIPNYQKKPGILDGALVLFQLRCNGVLEGIRICRQGYPNRMLYEEFKNRYRILDSKNVDLYTEPREGTEMICKAIGLKIPDDFQMGITKIFCRAGTFGQLESERTKKLSAILTGLQSYIRWHLTQKTYKVLQEEKGAMIRIQDNVRHWVHIQKWTWWKLFCKIKPLMQAPMEELKQEVETLKTKKDVLEQQLNNTENENLNLKKEVYRLENDVEKIIENSKAQEYELDSMRKEMDRQESLMGNMHKDITKQTDELDQLKSVLEKEQNDTKDLRCSNANLEVEISELENNLLKEKKIRGDLEERNYRSGSQLRELQRQLQQLQQTKNSLQKAITSRDDKTEFLTSKVNDQRDKIRKLQEMIKELQAKIDDLEAQLFHEKAARRRAEKLKAELEDDVSDLKLKMTKLRKAYNGLVCQNQAKDNEIEKLKKQITEEAQHKEEALEELRKRHAASSLQFQQQIEQLHKKSLKLESENQQLKGQIDQESWTNDPSRYRSLTRRRHSMQHIELQSKYQVDAMSRSYISRSGSSADILGKRLEDLEREIKELQMDLRMKKREIEVYKKTLQEETAEKEAFSKQVKICLEEIDSVNHQLLQEEEKRDELSRNLAKSHSELLEWKTKCEEKLIDREAEFLEEKKKLKQKLTDVTRESAEIAAKLHTEERISAEYNEEMKEKEMELEKAHAIASSLEKVQKNQEKALEQWSTTVREMANEINGLKEDNTKLRIELRHHKREHNEFDEYSDVGNLTDSGRESVDEESVLKKLELALSEKVELEEQLKQKQRDFCNIEEHSSPDAAGKDVQIRMLEIENEKLLSEKEDIATKDDQIKMLEMENQTLISENQTLTAKDEQIEYLEVENRRLISEREKIISEKVELEERLGQERDSLDTDHSISQITVDAAKDEQIQILEAENQKLISEKESLNEEIHRLHRICHELNVNVNAEPNFSSQEQQSLQNDERNEDVSCALFCDVDTEVTNFNSQEQQNLQSDEYNEDVSCTFFCDVDTEMTIHLPQ